MGSKQTTALQLLVTICGSAGCELLELGDSIGRPAVTGDRDGHHLGALVKSWIGQHGTDRVGDGVSAGVDRQHAASTEFGDTSGVEELVARHRHAHERNTVGERSHDSAEARVRHDHGGPG